MYKQHFALKHYPFQRTLYADELFEAEAQGEARARIRHLLDLRGIGHRPGAILAWRAFSRICQFTSFAPIARSSRRFV